MAAFLNRPEMLSYENPARDFQGITSPDPAHVLRRLAAKSRREEECTGGFSPAACLQTAALARKAAEFCDNYLRRFSLAISAR